MKLSPNGTRVALIISNNINSTETLRGLFSQLEEVSIMQLYELYQNIVIGTSITCVIGLAVAWVFFLSNRGK